VKDQRNGLWRDAIPDAVRSLRLIQESGQAVFFEALLPDIEKRPGNSKDAAGLIHVAAQVPCMLHAQFGPHFRCLDLLVDLIFP